MSAIDLQALGVAKNPSSLLIPERTQPHGPVTAGRIRRLVILLSVLWVVGLLPLALGAPLAWKALGMGLFFPGAGFLYTSDPALAVSTAVLFVGALVAWFLTGNLLAPPVIWFGAAALATFRIHTGIWSWAEWAVPATVTGMIGVGLVAQKIAFHGAQRRGAERNRYLAEIIQQSSDEIGERKGASLEIRDRTFLKGEAEDGLELSAEDLAAARFLLDRALQPLDRFDGFDWIDQFQTASVRYQLNFTQYALALLQYTRLPAFDGYLSEAQRNLITKMQDKRIWQYWRWENLFGNLDSNPDPIPRDNIMFSGYFGLMIGLYESNRPDARYDAPGAIALQWSPERTFRYDHHSINEAVYRNFKKSPFGMFPCEPNWIYTPCNAFGMNTLIVHDRLHGSRYSEDLREKFANAVNCEFLTAEGRVTAIRSSRLGITIPSLTSTMTDAGNALLMHPALPEAAVRSWLVVRRELISIDEKRRAHLQLRGWDKIDVGNYKRSDVSAHAIIMAAAREMGDEEVYEAVKATADEKFAPAVEDGVFRYRGASTQTNNMFALGRFGRLSGFRDLVVQGWPTKEGRGVVLDEAPYPDVLVARAKSDGQALEIVLRPGGSGGRMRLGVKGLKPGAKYEVGGACEPRFIAGADGSGRIEVELAGRTVVRLFPQP